MLSGVNLVRMSKLSRVTILGSAGHFWPAGLYLRSTVLRHATRNISHVLYHVTEIYIHLIAFKVDIKRLREVRDFYTQLDPLD